jgi:hypothetical protein
MDEQDVIVEPANALFARTMEILTWVGLVIVAIPGIAYIIGTKGFVGVNLASQDWNLPASLFWMTAKGIKISGYFWFMDHLSCMDCVSLVGVVILALIPVLSIVVATLKIDTKYRIIMGIITLEFVIAIVRPVLSRVLSR